MTSALYISTGIALYAAVQSLLRATRAPAARASVNILYALLCLSVAGFTASKAWLQSVPPMLMPLIDKAVIACGLLSWFTLLWLVTLLFRPQRLGLLIGLSVPWCGLLLLNLTLPASLVHFNFTPMSMPAVPSPAGIDLIGRLSQGWLLVHAVIAVSWGYLLWCTRQVAQTSQQPVGLTGWWVALFLLGAATGIDLFISAGLLSAAYLSPYTWTLLVMLAAGLLGEPTVRAALSNSSAIVKSGQSIAVSNSAAPRVSSVAASGQEFDSRSYLPVATPGEALHLHWHLDPVGQDSSARVQDFRAEERLEPEAVVESVPAGRPTQVAASKDDSIPHSLEIDLTEIVQFTRIALRRIERGKTDADKFATLFRAIQQKAQAARTALATVAADVDIYEHVANVLMQADTELQANGIRIVQRLAKDLPATDVDPIVLEQILHELLHEAIEATLEASQDVRKPIVLIGCATQDGGIELSITDGGAEVSLAEIQGIFESLLAEDKATAEVPLIMASELIAAQGGRLWCAPNPAGGSIRYLRLPGVAV